MKLGSFLILLLLVGCESKLEKKYSEDIQRLTQYIEDDSIKPSKVSGFIIGFNLSLSTQYKQNKKIAEKFKADQTKLLTLVNKRIEKLDPEFTNRKNEIYKGFSHLGEFLLAVVKDRLKSEKKYKGIKAFDKLKKGECFALDYSREFKDKEEDIWKNIKVYQVAEVGKDNYRLVTIYSAKESDLVNPEKGIQNIQKEEIKSKSETLKNGLVDCKNAMALKESYLKNLKYSLESKPVFELMSKFKYLAKSITTMKI